MSISLITFSEAYKNVLSHSQDYGNEKVFLSKATGRVLAENVLADRNFPPFNRSTKDGIAINFAVIENNLKSLVIEGVVPAGVPQSKLSKFENCVEIMTGAVVPENADTVVMYEHITIENGKATLHKTIAKGQNIHYKGGDEKQESVVLKKNTRISAAEIGVLAAVGKAEVLVKKLPKITLISTGNELVPVHETPLPHQIRNSNMHSLASALSEEGITPNHLHLLDDPKEIKASLERALQENDVLLLSGGVSKGKYDFIPDALHELGVEKQFHRVLQRPGKPFWFGVQKEMNTVVFSFPGNPASTFANYHAYFKDWLKKSLELPIVENSVILMESIDATGDLTRFIRAKIVIENGQLTASKITGNGSGDLTSLAQSDGFIKLEPRDTPYEIGEDVPFISTRKIL